ncbi:MAG: rRNA methyltransferase [Acidobacteria bacterium]|nr:rRNA methyltransferase [Acidobacteriota bacterium]
MQLPPALRAALENEAARFRLAELSAAHARLSESYRNGIPLQRLSDAERMAYALARMPATYAAGRAVLEEVARVFLPALSRHPEKSAASAITTILDLGAGTGALAWAAAECIPTLRQMTLLESDAGMIALGRTLAASLSQGAPLAAIREAEWVQADMASEMAGAQFTPHDLVALSYSLGELPADAASRVLEQAWNAARRLLIIIEPGTPAGFARVREWRTKLLGMGAHMVAPCPHARECPLTEVKSETKIETKAGNDWCHFAQRVERTALHRRLKGGQLGHEDEKFSYIAFSKVPVALPEARIIRHPHVAPGVIKLNLCAVEGLRGAVITKRDRPAFRRARHAKWGEAWDEAGGAEIQTEPRPSGSGGSLGE